MITRGEVRLVYLDLPDSADPTKTSPKAKWVVALQGGTEFARMRDVAVVVASTNRQQRFPRDHEVQVGTADGFDHDTLIDGRWVFTIPQAAFESGQYRCVLSDGVMELVNEALVVGLQME
jgi:hypothetical protein